jgi:hypothetical protein
MKTQQQDIISQLSLKSRENKSLLDEIEVTKHSLLKATEEKSELEINNTNLHKKITQLKNNNEFLTNEKLENEIQSQNQIDLLNAEIKKQSDMIIGLEDQLQEQGMKLQSILDENANVRSNSTSNMSGVSSWRNESMEFDQKTIEIDSDYDNERTQIVKNTQDIQESQVVMLVT